MHKFANNGKNNVQANKPSSIPEEVIQDQQENNQVMTDEKNSNPLNGLLSNLFSGGKLDSDKLIILILIAILAKEGVDLKLLIALGYIII